MTLSLHETGFVLPTVRPAPSLHRAAHAAAVWVGSGVLVLALWSVSLVITVHGLMRHDTPTLAFLEIGAAALPAIGGIGLARLVHRSPVASIWVWLGILPSLAGWYLLIPLV